MDNFTCPVCQGKMNYYNWSDSAWCTKCLYVVYNAKGTKIDKRELRNCSKYLDLKCPKCGGKVKNYDNLSKICENCYCNLEAISLIDVNKQQEEK
jgi:transcription initiation factor IIE alpha subunit